MKLVTIIDYGSGNIKSVFNAFNLLSRRKENLKVLVSSNKSDISNSTHLVLPGVGSFKSCIDGLKRSNLIETISKKVNSEKTPFLGICVGMQMLASKGFENGEFSGLKLDSRRCKKNIKKSKKFKNSSYGME